MSPEATLAAGIACSADERRELVLANVQVQGIDYVEVSADQRVLELHFIGEDDPARHAHLDALLDELAQHPERLAIAGGTRVRDVAVVAVARSGHHLEVTVSKPGDFSGYTLRIDPAAGVDPVYSEVRIDFKAGCPARFDCRPGPPPTAALPERPIDYMAKDYASFRQALLDLLPTLIPDWRERLEADLGIVLVELLAYVADQLSYFQDAVANEAYLATARQRVSVRRHARLVDYRMHDGLSARALVHFRVAAPVTIEAGTPLLTRILEPIGSSSAPPGAVLTGLPSEIARARSLADAEFETVDELHADPALNEIELYEWGDADCCLPAGATAADLAGGELAGKLSRGDLLVLEEVLGPETGLTSDADPRHRQAVRITEVEEGGVDTLPDSDVDYVRVHWDAADALAFPLCLSRRSADGTVRGVSVARGNIALALHGRAAEEWHPGDPRLAPGIQPGPRAYRFRLGASPLGFAPAPPRPGTPPRAVTELMAADPREARPRVRLRVLTSDEATRAADGDAVDSPLWTPRRDLLASAPAALDFAVETEDDAGALIRFGRDDFGHAPEQDRYVQVQYRVGAGAAGNVGAEAIAHALAGGPAAAAVAAVRNPVPAFGGVEPEPVAVVREAAPAAFRAEQLRAVTEDDYARAAESSPLVSKAVATFRWTGSWITVFVTVDRVGRTGVDEELREHVRAVVERQTQAGYDLEVETPLYVPLELALDVCVDRRHFRADVEAALLDALGSRDVPGRGRGLFHPDNFSFGQPVHASRVYAAAMAVEGVSSVTVASLTRLGEPAGLPPGGALAIGRLEIARLDNDPSFPENGVLELAMRGGK